jgi:hypothetical protein
VNRNKLKATALTALAETLLIAVTLTAGLAVYHLTIPINTSVAVVTAISIAFGTHGVTAPLITAGFGPTIDRLNNTPTATDPETESR